MVDRRFVVRLPLNLAEKVMATAGEQDMLPTEWIRQLIRETFEKDKAQEVRP